jgi:hypothetical protein
MGRNDLLRELIKAQEALTWTEKYLTRENEANAALHLNERVFYSPLTTQVHDAVASLGRVITDLSEEK